MSESIQDSLSKEVEEVTNSLGSSGISRKDFLKYSGAAGAAVATLGLIGCEDDPIDTEEGIVVLPGGDFGVLNYAYALEQLEAAFYIRVVANPFDGMSAEEGAVLEDVRDHEVAHRAFYNAALGEKAIPALTPNFSAVDFSSRASVLGTALTFENVGVSAYNGAGALLDNVTFLVVAGKIVSVEARHSAAISDLVRPNVGVAGNQLIGGDSPIINANGLDLARPVGRVLEIVDPFIEETIDASAII